MRRRMATQAASASQEILSVEMTSDKVAIVTFDDPQSKVRVCYVC